MPEFHPVVVGLTLLAAFVGTLALRRYALARQIIDTPNARSSHSVPTPRGGGVAIVLAYLTALIFWEYRVGMAYGLFWSLLFGGGLIAVLGFWDDHAPLPARVRFGFHLLAAGLAMFLLGGWPRLDLGGSSLYWGWLGYLSGVLLLAWAINFYNFMDGIDGLAGSQAVFVAGAGGVMLSLTGGDGMPLWLLAAASAGFLLLNWPPARIFMGDAGSGFLGYALFLHALYATTSGQTTLWPWMILLAVFMTDATLTLLRRALRGIRVTEAHRTHAYQWASRRAGAHRPVTLVILCINLLVMLPAALATQAWPTIALPVCLLIFALLVGLAWYFDAGVPESECAREAGVCPNRKSPDA
ncbi:glycosyltransferase family 4 protein [Uliginosibacterium sp. 31-12]|uniref:MraY family glycosyltransferase n=1 Tax=Uliginosibacterium sp. 31-12 TaxID=3062781 RepID=UPI0026E12ED1|nr:glycosyltransferase family 4 protein [Uliginosibacterium sp. 31-12]MDO6386071.1 glycosyltransferase family 4 protein [Uliginosibacterium sp. 31-12]